jgi:predicted O-methyltransferase YrrM
MAFHPAFGIAMTDAQYMQNWAKESASLEGIGAYTWMAVHLAGASRVLEVGCGSGRGTLALLSSPRQVIAVEANEAALSATEALLDTNGFSSVRVPALGLAAGRPEDVVLVEASFLDVADKATANLRLDAVACWNIGAAPALIATHNAVSPESLPPQAIGEYRLAVQRACYRLAARAMDKGALVHVVDRTAVDVKQMKLMATELTRMQQEICGPGVSIDPVRTVLHPYTIPSSMIQYLAAQALPPNATRAFGSTVGTVL